MFEIIDNIITWKTQERHHGNICFRKAWRVNKRRQINHIEPMTTLLEEEKKAHGVLLFSFAIMYFWLPQRLACACVQPYAEVVLYACISALQRRKHQKMHQNNNGWTLEKDKLKGEKRKAESRRWKLRMSFSPDSPTYCGLNCISHVGEAENVFLSRRMRALKRWNGHVTVIWISDPVLENKKFYTAH